MHAPQSSKDPNEAIRSSIAQYKGEQCPSVPVFWGGWVWAVSSVPTIPSDDPENPKKSRRVIKFYILQFVCFYYRCLHLEVLIAPIFAKNVLQAIQRFVARKGKIDFL